MLSPRFPERCLGVALGEHRRVARRRATLYVRTVFNLIGKFLWSTGATKGGSELVVELSAGPTRANKLPIITKFHRKLRPFESLKWTRVHCLHARAAHTRRPPSLPAPRDRATFLREPGEIRGPDVARAPASASFDL